MLKLPSDSLRYIAKRTLKKDVLKKILDLKDKEEQKILFEYSIKVNLEMKYAELKDKVEMLEKKKGDVFIPVTKVYLLGSKIHYLSTTFHKRDFKNVSKLFKEIEKEVKNV